MYSAVGTFACLAAAYSARAFSGGTMSCLPPSRKIDGGSRPAAVGTGPRAKRENAARPSNGRRPSTAVATATPAPGDQPTAPTWPKGGRGGAAASAATRCQVGNGSGPLRNPPQKPLLPGGGVG